jgi:hypothetical protein
MALNAMAMRSIFRRPMRSEIAADTGTMKNVMSSAMLFEMRASFDESPIVTVMYE